MILKREKYGLEIPSLIDLFWFFIYRAVMTKIAIASDHAGFELKQELIHLLHEMNHEVLDHGCHSEDSVDYPDFAILVAQDVQKKKSDLGILVCGTGIGMAITANKYNGIRAASVWSVEACRMAREHNDLNVLCLAARLLKPDQAKAITQTFLHTPFSGGRHADRLAKITKQEGTQCTN